METRTFTCISCPIGCRLTVEIEDGKIKEISGNKCARGVTYAENEIYNPKRTLTSTVRIIGGTLEQLPVRTREPIPKGKMKDAMLYLKDLKVEAPVALGDVVVSDFLETGIALIATRSVDKKDQLTKNS